MPLKILSQMVAACPKGELTLDWGAGLVIAGPRGHYTLKCQAATIGEGMPLPCALDLNPRDASLMAQSVMPAVAALVAERERAAAEAQAEIQREREHARTVSELEWATTHALRELWAAELAIADDAESIIPRGVYAGTWGGLSPFTKDVFKAAGDPIQQHPPRHTPRGVFIVDRVRPAESALYEMERELQRRAVGHLPACIQGVRHGRFTLNLRDWDRLTPSPDTPAFAADCAALAALTADTMAELAADWQARQPRKRRQVSALAPSLA